MENTLENKAKFFAQYWGQKVIIYREQNLQSVTHKTIHESILNNCLLELTPLSDITDEDAIEVGKHWFPYKSLYHTPIWGRKFAINQTKDFGYELTDYLRSKGYALPYMGLSVEKLIKYGWVKLKNIKDED